MYVRMYVCMHVAFRNLFVVCLRTHCIDGIAVPRLLQHALQVGCMAWAFWDGVEMLWKSSAGQRLRE